MEKPIPAPFRAALASDGSLILFVPGMAGPVDLTRADTCALIDYLRKLDALSPPSAPELPSLLAPQVC